MKVTKKIIGSVALATILAFSATGCGSSSNNDDDTPAETPAASTGVTQANKQVFLTTYADIALLNYTDAHADAKKLVVAVKAFTASPTDATLSAAKTAWIASRESYSPTEIFRLTDGPIDAEEGFAASWDAPEGQLNAWPLDENMIDYTLPANSTTRTTGNIIDTKGKFTPSGDGATAVDVTTITTSAISALNENGGDANVATGYHAVEFLLWGQDQDYADFTADTVTNGKAVAGQRPVTDYTSAANADRRKAYLVASAELIVEDLAKMVKAWSKDPSSYRAAFLGKGANAIKTDVALKNVFYGMGQFIKSELANERIAVALLTPSEEDEHSCFSDNTHRDIVLNFDGFKNIMQGKYKGTKIGKSVGEFVSTAQKGKMSPYVKSITADLKAMNDKAATCHFDYQIKDGSETKQNIKDAKNNMRKLGDEMVNVAKEFGITMGDVADPDETQL